MEVRHHVRSTGVFVLIDAPEFSMSVMVENTSALALHNVADDMAASAQRILKRAERIRAAANQIAEQETQPA